MPTGKIRGVCIWPSVRCVVVVILIGVVADGETDDGSWNDVVAEMYVDVGVGCWGVSLSTKVASLALQQAEVLHRWDRRSGAVLRDVTELLHRREELGTDGLVPEVKRLPAENRCGPLIWVMMSRCRCLSSLAL